MGGRLDGQSCDHHGRNQWHRRSDGARCSPPKGHAWCWRAARPRRAKRSRGSSASDAMFQRADVMREADIAALVDTAMQRFGRLDCLFNNAGAPTPGTLETVTEQEFNYAMQLLVGSVVFGIKHAVRVMKPQGRRQHHQQREHRSHRIWPGRDSLLAAKAAVAISRASPASSSDRTAFASMRSRPARSPRRSSGAARRARTHSATKRINASSPSSRTTSRRRHRCRAPGIRTTSQTQRCFSPATKAASSTATTWSSTADASGSSMNVTDVRPTGQLANWATGQSGVAASLRF